MMNETDAACKDNSQAAKWGGMFDVCTFRFGLQFDLHNADFPSTDRHAP